MGQSGKWNERKQLLDSAIQPFIRPSDEQSNVKSKLITIDLWQ